MGKVGEKSPIAVPTLQIQTTRDKLTTEQEEKEIMPERHTGLTGRAAASLGLVPQKGNGHTAQKQLV